MREVFAMKTRAAIAHAAGKPLEIVTVDLDGPKSGEVLVELQATGVCHTGGGETIGDGAVINTGKVETGANVVVFGLGGIGLNVVQGAGLAGANKIIGVQLNPNRRALCEKFGMTHFVNAKVVEGDLV